MKKTPVILFLAILSTSLAACQNSTPSQHQSADTRYKSEKASASTQFSIEVKDPNSPASSATVDISNTVGLQVTSSGFKPPSLSAKVGYDLLIHNSLDQQIDLYTTSNKGQDCPVLGPVIEIPGGQTKTILLTMPLQCTLVNQTNTNQKATLTVE